MTDPITLGVITGGVILLWWIFVALNRIATVLEDMHERLKNRSY